jgi:hypothetical protein
VNSTRKAVTAIVTSAFVLTIGAAPLLVRGADHLDAPGLMSPEGRLQADILDVYVFEGSDAGRTVLATTIGPGAGAIAPTKFSTNVDYVLNVDGDGDAIQDLAYVMRFGKGRGGRQSWELTRYAGDSARTLTGGKVLGDGMTGRSDSVKGQGMVFAGLRSDPFFFDLDAFLDDVLGQDRGRSFCDGADGAGSDFFAPLNANAIVIEVPDGALGGMIGVWVATVGGDGQIDRMGRPAINTVFNAGADKNAFNAGRPRDDLAVFGDNVAAVLDTFSALDTEGPYTEADRDTLVGVLLPDILTYDTATAAAGPLNGRGLADDVIDAELNIVTGGFEFPGRDAAGAIGTDCVGPHTDYRATFPYLGTAH